jgi:FkbM family methyltransferase
VRGLAAVVPRLPFGRYWVMHQLRRFAIPPFVMRLPPDLGGFAFQCDQRDSVSREVCFTGRYEPQETQLASRILRAGDTFVDVGANWGYFTLAAAHWVGAGGRVLAFEPEPRLFEMLTSNLEANGLAFVRAHRVAAAAGPGRLGFTAFRADGGNWGRSRSVAAGGRPDFDCETVGLDDALDAAGIGRVQLTKIDVEGGEAAVLDGMGRGLADGRYRYVFVECHRALLRERGLTEADCVARLLDAGYRAWIVTHTPALHRRAARHSLPALELMRPYRPGDPVGEWPHVVAAAPAAPDPQ